MKRGIVQFPSSLVRKFYAKKVLGEIYSLSGRYMKEYNPDVSLYTGASGVSLYMSCFEQTFLTSQELRKNYG